MAIYALGVIAFAFLVLLFGGVLLGRRRRLIGSLTTTTGLVILLTGIVVFLITINIATYQRLTHEIPLARLSVQSKEKRGYQVIYEDLNKGTKVDFLLTGDEWQMDARFLKWRAWATILGRDPLVRPERLSGRFRDIEQARTRLPTVFSLARDSAIDVWKLAREFKQMQRWADTYYGSAVYMPLEVGASYQVNATASGLIVRPVNAVARKVVSAWH